MEYSEHDAIKNTYPMPNQCSHHLVLITENLHTRTRKLKQSSRTSLFRGASNIYGMDSVIMYKGL